MPHARHTALGKPLSQRELPHTRLLTPTLTAFCANCRRVSDLGGREKPPTGMIGG